MRKNDKNVKHKMLHTAYFVAVYLWCEERQNEV